MRLANATLKTRNLGFGDDFVRSEVPLGKTYTIDLDSVDGFYAVEGGTGRHVLIQAAMVYENGKPAGYMPMPLLNVEGPVEQNVSCREG